MDVMIFMKEGNNMTTFDYKKEYKDLYLPKTKPMIIEVPTMNYVAVHGFGDPNEESGDYRSAIQLLYGISFTIKMSHKSNTPLKGYYEYTIPPLEGLWWMKNGQIPSFHVESKKDFEWYSMIRLPEFVDQAIFDWACKEFSKKHPEVNTTKASFFTYEEGLCAQVMHKGSYDNEGITIDNLHTFIKEQGYVCDYDGISTTGQLRKHHELYLGDPRRSKPENLKTVIRLPIKKGVSYE